MRNRYPGYCMDGCGTWVEAKGGHPHRDKGRWFVRCISCVEKGRIERRNHLVNGEAPSPATFGQVQP